MIKGAMRIVTHGTAADQGRPWPSCRCEESLDK
jgi:hypothetical protein